MPLKDRSNPDVLLRGTNQSTWRQEWSPSFSSSPTTDGWIYTGTETLGWDWENGSLVAEIGQNWYSPTFELPDDAGGTYYRIQYDVLAPAGEYGIATFGVNNENGAFGVEPISSPLYYGRPGQLLDDNYSSELPASSWTTHQFYARVPANATKAFFRIGSHYEDGERASFDNVSVAAATDAEVLAWADQQYGRLSTPSTFERDDSYDAELSQFASKLTSGQKTRIVMVGDSIVSDTLNSTFELQLERLVPGADVEIIAAVGHGTGMNAWINPERGSWKHDGLDFKANVIDQNPDLVIISGISNGGDANLQATADAIDLLRAGQAFGGPDILLMTGAFGSGQTTSRMAIYGPQLLEIAGEKQTAFFDMYSAWDNYIDQLDLAGQDPTKLRRDSTHANSLGKQTIGRILSKQLAMPLTVP